MVVCLIPIGHDIRSERFLQSSLKPTSYRAGVEIPKLLDQPCAYGDSAEHAVARSGAISMVPKLMYDKSFFDSGEISIVLDFLLGRSSTQRRFDQTAEQFGIDYFPHCRTGDTIPNLCNGQDYGIET